jgi:hypothetical protein
MYIYITYIHMYIYIPIFPSYPHHIPYFPMVFATFHQAPAATVARLTAPAGNLGCSKDLADHLEGAINTCQVRGDWMRYPLVK